MKKVFYETIKPRKPRGKPKQYELKLTLKAYAKQKENVGQKSQDAVMTQQINQVSTFKI